MPFSGGCRPTNWEVLSLLFYAYCFLWSDFYQSVSCTWSHRSHRLLHHQLWLGKGQVQDVAFCYCSYTRTFLVAP